MRRSRAGAVVLLALLASPGCMWRRTALVMEELPTPGCSYEVLGEVEGQANFTQVLTLFATGTHRGTEGVLLSPSRALGDGATIPVLDPLLRRVAAVVMGTTRIERTRRVALGRALEAARALGADSVVAPRFEIETRSFTCLVPLGFLHSTGAVTVHAKAVRLVASAAGGAADNLSGGAAEGAQKPRDTDGR